MYIYIYEWTCALLFLKAQVDLLQKIATDLETYSNDISMLKSYKLVQLPAAVRDVN